MKKIGLLIAGTALATSATFAQGFNFRLGLGYAMPLASGSQDNFGQAYNGSYDNSTNAFTVKPASFSTGVNATVGVGYDFTQHLGVRLDMMLGLANKKYTYTLYNVNVNGVASDVAITQQANSPSLLLPSMVVQTGGKTLNAYTRFGLALPTNTTMIQHQIITNQPLTGTLVVKDGTYEITNNFSLGFTAAGGASYKLNDRCKVWAELSILSLSVYTKESNLTDYTINGTSYSTSSSVSYSKTGVVDSNYDHQPTYAQPFSNVSFNIGLQYSIGHSRSRGRAVKTSDPQEGDRPRGGSFR